MKPAASAATARTAPAAARPGIVDAAGRAPLEGSAARADPQRPPRRGMPPFPDAGRRARRDRRVRRDPESARRRSSRGRRRRGRRAVLHGKGNCAGCHMVRGRGGHPRAGPVEPRARAEARRRSNGPDEPGTAPPARRRAGEARPTSLQAVSVRLRDGRTIRGLAKYESPFDLGVQSARRHSFIRSRGVRSRSSRGSRR